MANKVGLVTGASSGIGWAVAVEMARHGYDLALIARRTDRLEALKKSIEDECKGQVIVNVGDIRKTKDMERIIHEAHAQLGRIDVVVANAGFTIPGRFDSLNVDDYKNIFDTNFFGMLNTIYPALPALEESKGTIMIMGSILGEFGIMDRSTYASTKFALRGFYESVRYELKERDISLMLVEPGFVKTELRFMDRKGNRIKVVTDKVKKKTSHSIAVPPEDIARQVVKILTKRGFRKKILTGHARVLAFLNWLLPGLLPHLIYKHREFVRRKVVK